MHKQSTCDVTALRCQGKDKLCDGDRAVRSAAGCVLCCGLCAVLRVVLCGVLCCAVCCVLQAVLLHVLLCCMYTYDCCGPEMTAAAHLKLVQFIVPHFRRNKVHALVPHAMAGLCLQHLWGC